MLALLLASRTGQIVAVAVFADPLRQSFTP
jgi:hypothetical protein